VGHDEVSLAVAWVVANGLGQPGDVAETAYA
jgi:hypothetical protein